MPALALLAACTEPAQVIIHTAQGGAVPVTVEIADTAETRTRGLMYRRELATDAGMLFIFPTASEQRFWMKNTPLPLDMIFIGTDHRIVGIVADTHPFSTTALGVPGPSQYVLEVNAGFSAKHGLAAGDVVDFVRIPGTAR